MEFRTKVTWEIKSNRLIRVVKFRGVSSKDGILGEQALIESSINIIEASKKYNGKLVPLREEAISIEHKTYCYFELIFPYSSSLYDFMNEFM